MRRGLATANRDEAEHLIAELDILLADSNFWQLAARTTAEQRFDARVTSAFYDGMEPSETNYWAIRERNIELPDSATSNYRRLLMVGTTGSGKTTLVRQLMGTDAIRERFPSTSTAKTTIADTEVVLADGDYRAAVTFMPLDEARDYLEQCVCRAVLAARKEDVSDAEIIDRALNHVSQRFRLTYVLGSGASHKVADEEDDEESDEFELELAEDDTLASAHDLGDTNSLLQRVVAGIRTAAKCYRADLRLDLQATDEDARAVDELLEEQMDKILREDDALQELLDEIVEEAKRRFDLVKVGTYERNTQGWPTSWYWECEDRQAFLVVVRRFASNSARQFGSLLTPLVNGIRVAGPFKPQWASIRPDLVLLDGEGLGHTPDTAVSLPTALTRRFDFVDAIVLVDNAAQPMQAGAVGLLKSLAASGQAAKLVACFTHFDVVKGDNLRYVADRERHVRASAENSLAEISRLGATAERTLRSRIESAAIFVGDIQQNLTQAAKSQRRTISQLAQLVKLVESIGDRPERGDSKPHYNLLRLSILVKESAEQYHRVWRARLGKAYDSEIKKQHWTRIKALTRRLAVFNEDQYDDLRPVADLHSALQQPIRAFIELPISWSGPEPDDDHKAVIFDEFANEISRHVLQLATQRVWDDARETWLQAFAKSGMGSTFERADLIADSIINDAAPIPTLAPSRGADKLLTEMYRIVRDAAQKSGVIIES